jgi:hypothetical protein
MLTRLRRFNVSVSVHTLDRRKAIGSALRQERCDQPVQKLKVKLESLILAQNERWRQA